MNHALENESLIQRLQEHVEDIGGCRKTEKCDHPEEDAGQQRAESNPNVADRVVRGPSDKPERENGGKERGT